MKTQNSFKNGYITLQTITFGIVTDHVIMHVIGYNAAPIICGCVRMLYF